MKNTHIDLSSSAFFETQQPCEKFNLVKKLGSSKFPVFLINDQETHTPYALKLFPFQHNEPHRSFTNEARFCFLDHPHIISFKRAQKAQKVSQKDIRSLASYIIMEYAPNGDLAKPLAKKHKIRDEKLVRTYFRHLIDGLEYLHKNQVSHMDLKLDNLLLDADYKLKIADFDTASMGTDSYTVGRGTKNYRAPELRNDVCLDPFAADIYAAGVILFILLTGCFPFIENSTVKGYNLNKLLDEESPVYWEALQKCKIQLNEDAKELFLSMVRFIPIERATLTEIRANKWFSGEIYANEELKRIQF